MGQCVSMYLSFTACERHKYPFWKTIYSRSHHDTWIHDTWIQLVTALLLKVSAPCSNALDCPFPHVRHCPLHHVRVKLGNLPGDIGLQLVEGGRAWAVDLGLEEAPEAEVEGGARSIPYSLANPAWL